MSELLRKMYIMHAVVRITQHIALINNYALLNEVSCKSKAPDCVMVNS